MAAQKKKRMQKRKDSRKKRTSLRKPQRRRMSLPKKKQKMKIQTRNNPILMCQRVRIPPLPFYINRTCSA